MMVALALRLKTARNDNAAHAAAKQLFSFSLLYLFALFAMLLVDHWLGRWPLINLG